MLKINRPLLIVEDDPDDKEMIADALSTLNFNNKIIFFNDGAEALDYLLQSEVRPFLILSDINMPGMDGLSFKRAIEATEKLKNKDIPFVYLSTSINDMVIKAAIRLTVQGFFEKGNSFDQLKKNLQVILNYWQENRHAP